MSSSSAQRKWSQYIQTHSGVQFQKNFAHAKCPSPHSPRKVQSNQTLHLPKNGILLYCEGSLPIVNTGHVKNQDFYFFNYKQKRSSEMLISSCVYKTKCRVNFNFRACSGPHGARKVQSDNQHHRNCYQSGEAMKCASIKPRNLTWKCRNFHMLELGALQASTLRCFLGTDFQVRNFNFDAGFMQTCSGRVRV